MRKIWNLFFSHELRYSLPPQCLKLSFFLFNFSRLEKAYLKWNNNGFVLIEPPICHSYFPYTTPPLFGTPVSDHCLTFSHSPCRRALRPMTSIGLDLFMILLEILMYSVNTRAPHALCYKLYFSILMLCSICSMYFLRITINLCSCIL